MAKVQAQGLRRQDAVWVWGAGEPHGLAEHVRSCGGRLMHVEDGFIRSVGLGSDLIRPLSLVLDERGVYFDATRPSDLEHMLATREFSDEDITRAQSVRIFIVKHGITKYNLEPRQSVAWPSSGKQVVLVPGQVEDDASIRLGCTTVKTNLGLLHAVGRSGPMLLLFTSRILMYSVLIARGGSLSTQHGNTLIILSQVFRW